MRWDIIGASRGGFITDLIIDEDTGNEILQVLNKQVLDWDIISLFQQSQLQ